ncbi:hypothetical protein BDV38DRAFT_18824 [Aspergillus pseudotamarii]|uniref:DUF7703 domain-containing protein n=2 Tax=Aspergillus subgen. Circumdati TaxID=2720871 RepID=A0A5N6T2H6_ASPPS|nr:uncharacterized protein BDV38DRAFT_18824 [Aspergillus pseudotamarii]KAE8140500.1 hypothetical protein BDV38DRAFT_18824 [Aspergillus pseudotamarii]KAE8156786.1 hypothetical protein BDV40DRAFT_67629 [Aspergillus tamarii]
MPRYTPENDGTGLARQLTDPLVAQYVYSVFIALAWCNALELVVLCLNTFKRYAGTYFWSLFVASISIIPFGLGYLLKMFHITFTNGYLELAITDIGWVGMVTGQSLVLWSRLHLVVHNRKVLKAILYLIIIDGVLLHTAATTLEFMNNGLSYIHNVTVAFGIMERIQVVWFCVQELLISSVYIVETAKLLRLDRGGPSRTILTQLIIVNVAIMVLDVAVVAVQFAGYFTLQVTTKVLVYSIKLKLEYIILGRLVDVAHIRSQPETPRFRF